jgi:hypothetical protein
MPYATIALVAFALCVLAWRAGRRKHPLTALRVVAILVLIVAGLVAMMLVDALAGLPSLH